MIDETGRGALERFLRDGECYGIGAAVEGGGGEGVQRAVEREWCALEQSSRGALHVLGVGEDETGCRIIQREAEAHFARRGDSGVAACQTCDLPREFIGAMMAPEQRDGGRAVLGQSDHRRFAALVDELGSDGTDEDARGAEADDGAAFAEEPGEMRCRLVVADVAALHAGRGVDLGFERLLQPRRQWQGRGAEHEEDGLHHASLPA